MRGSLAKSRWPLVVAGALCHASDRETTCSIWTASEVSGPRTNAIDSPVDVDQDTALGVARAWPHDQLADRTLGGRPPVQPSDHGGSPDKQRDHGMTERRVGMSEPT